MTSTDEASPGVLRFRVLGPLEIHAGQRWRPVGAAKQRALLSLLVLNANRVAPSEQLISELWGDHSPGSARTLLAGYVWRLRKLLGDDSGAMLVTRPLGYQLAVPAGVVDLYRHDELCVTGRGQAAAGNLGGAVASFSAALALWRGAPFADVPLMPSVMAETARLEETRLAIIEARIDAEIRLGRHEGLLPELKLLVSQHPLREQLHAQLMLVLYRSGQQAEALGAYHDLRRLLVDELGIEPSRPLRDLQRRILREDPSLSGDTPASPNGQLAPPRVVLRPPSAPGTLAGHGAALAVLTSRLAAGQRLCAIHGMAGTGKSTLALRAADEAAAYFPHGQVYLDLRGSAPGEPAAPAEVAWHLLRACGAPGGEMPADLDDATARLNARLAGRRMLIILDDVLSTAQIRPVLTLPADCAALIISRQAQSAVDGPNQVRLGQLTAAQGLDLFGRCVGPARIRAEPAAASAVVRWCECLPLALRIAGIRLTLRPDWSVEALAEQLADPGRRLDVLACGELSVRASLAAGVRIVQRAGESAALRALDLLAALDLPIVTADALSVLLDLGSGESERLAGQLVSAGLIDPVGGDRYWVPELVRLFARDMAQVRADSPAAADAVRRVVEHYAAASPSAPSAAASFHR